MGVENPLEHLQFEKYCKSGGFKSFAKLTMQFKLSLFVRPFLFFCIYPTGAGEKGMHKICNHEIWIEYLRGTQVKGNLTLRVLQG